MFSTICLKDCSNKWVANRKTRKVTVYILETSTLLLSKLAPIMTHWTIRKGTFQNSLIPSTPMRLRPPSSHQLDWSVWCKIIPNFCPTVIKSASLISQRAFASALWRMTWKQPSINSKKDSLEKVLQHVKLNSITSIEFFWESAVPKFNNANQFRQAKSSFLCSQWFTFHLTLLHAIQ